MMDYLYIHYVDSSGNNLFTDGKNGYLMDSVKIFDYKNGDTTFIVNGFSFAVYLEDKMVVHLNADITNGYCNSIIRLKPGTYDTLAIHVTGSSFANYRYDSIWYNGHTEPLTDSGFTVVK